MSGKTVVAGWMYGTKNQSAACLDSAGCCTGTSCASSGDYVTYVFAASTAGDKYFVCSLGNGAHCKAGQKVHVRVKQDAANAAASVSACLVVWFSIAYFM